MIKELTKREDKILQILRDPVAWGEHYLNNRDGSPRIYWKHQREDLRCKTRNIIHQDGRDNGKTVALVGHLLHYAFTTKGGEALVCAPYQGHIDKIIKEVELQFDMNPDLQKCLSTNYLGKPKITRKPYYEFEFTNGTIVYFRPAGVRGEAFRSLHVNRIYVDEAAWIPDEGWEALRMCLVAGGKMRIYSTPSGIRTAFYYRLTKMADSEKEWEKFLWPSWISPLWTKEHERELLAFYNGKETPGWQHEVAGEHGAPSFGAFNLNQFFICLQDVPEYWQLSISGDEFKNCKDENAVTSRIRLLLNQPDRIDNFWLGGDLGYTNDPTELIIFQEIDDCFRMVGRIHAEHVAYPIVSNIISVLDSIFHFQGLGVDNGGNGMSVVQELKNLDRYRKQRFENRLQGFDFGGTTTIGYTEDAVPIKKRTKEFMTSLINQAFNKRLVIFPEIDRELEDQFATHTYHLGERHIIYSKGNDHIVDAVRCAFMAREFVKLVNLDPMMEEVDVGVIATSGRFYF